MKDISILSSNGVDVNGSLEILGDMEMYDETLNDFLEEMTTRLVNMDSYKKAGDMENYAILVHALKSDSKYLGFTKLAELSFNQEMESKANNADYIDQHYDELITEVNRIITLVKQYLNM
ncbi:MAG: Hpt domain-containing protein [Bacilli bacterium]|nr:Hpt domain-containing protein [Bacilli bacterium]